MASWKSDADVNTAAAEHVEDKGTHRETGTCTRNTQGQGSTLPDMWVVALTQQLNDPWHLCVVPEEYESQTGNSGTTNVVIGIRNRDLQKLSCRLVVACPRVGKTDGVHATVPKDSVL